MSASHYLRAGAIAAGLIAILAGAGAFSLTNLRSEPSADVLYGNVEIRQTDLSFNAAGRVEALFKQEGDIVRKGDLLAQLDDASYRSANALARARRDAAQSALNLLLAGTRQETIAQARASVAVAVANLANADTAFARQEKLTNQDVTARQTYEDALRARDAARATLAQMQAVLDEAVNGPRPDEIAEARAQLAAADAAQQLSDTQLANTRLTSPSDGQVMTRVVEPGTVVLPANPVYSIAINGEVWVRAFAPETHLGRVAPGTTVSVADDGGHVWRGRIGYVSPVAEFTPKTVETPELRTQLVYRLRVRIENPDTAIRQGMPVTITLPPAGNAQG